MSKEIRIVDLEDRFIDFPVRIIPTAKSLPETKIENHIPGELVEHAYFGFVEVLDEKGVSHFEVLEKEYSRDKQSVILRILLMISELDVEKKIESSSKEGLTREDIKMVMERLLVSA